MLISHQLRVAHCSICGNFKNQKADINKTQLNEDFFAFGE